MVVPMNENPLPEEFKFTTDVLSLLKINPNHKPLMGRIKAETSEAYGIFKQRFPIGDHVIKLVQKKDVKNHFTLFYTPDPAGNS